MKKIIPFIKDIKFNTKIYEISSISLEHNLAIDDDNQIDGEFIISGDYKMNDSSINTEPFIYSIPFDISLDSIYDTDNLKIDIDDFKYEIINEEILKINIDVLVEGEEKKIIEEEITPDVIIDVRKEVDKSKTEEERKDDVIEDYMPIDDLFKEEDKEPITVNKEIEQNNKVTSIFESFDSKDEKYVTYYVHIVRDNDTIESIALKYNVNIDDIKEYNDMKQITLGNKIIIPYINNETI